MNEFVIETCGEEAYLLFIKYVNIDSGNTLLLSTSTIFNIQKATPNITAIINIQRVNDFRYINKMFEAVNLKLNNENIYIGCFETFSARRKRKPINKIPIISLFYFGMEYIFLRVFPKIWGLKKIYFFITRGKNRLLSKAEVLGRLVSCGFEIIEYVNIKGYTYFVVKKIKSTEFNMKPSYGPVFKMSRVGKHGKIIGVYKVRTMYAFAEYLQKYIYEKNGSTNGDKANDDFRVSTFGKFIRKCWIDEVPMLINLIKGEIKLIGPRPLSVPKFNMYPKYAQEKRCQFKPGLIPPFYYDLPNSFDDLVKSEMKYLSEYEKHPFRTDFKYFFMAIYNIIFKGARSK
ncbi:MAG: sugar transferase [Sphingobacteriaceae bacterium]|nr:sugar transferase [Sphingobacteriaceae bacterium]